MNKKRKIVICIIAIVALIAVAFSIAFAVKHHDTTDTTTATSIVNVTDKDGKDVTEIVEVTDKDGETVTDSTGETVTKAVAVTKVVTVTEKNNTTNKANTFSVEKNTTANKTTTTKASTTTTKKVSTTAKTVTTTKASTTTTTRKTGHTDPVLCYAMLDEMNEDRTANGKTALVWGDTALETEAKKRCVELITEYANNTVHSGMSRAYGANEVAAEPNYYYSEIASDVEDAWMNSAGHKYIMMTDYTDYEGDGYTYNTMCCAYCYSYDTGLYYWIAVFQMK